MKHRAKVVAINFEGEKDNFGDPIPKNYVKVAMLWLPNEPTSPWIPVYNAMRHNTTQEWYPLEIGQDVLVEQVDASPGMRGSSWVVTDFGPVNADEDGTGDYRETSEYRVYKGKTIDKWVKEPTDPVEGDNDDAGRSWLDHEGLGITTRTPTESDPNRFELEMAIPGGSMLIESRKDGSTKKMTIDFNGTKIETDAVAQVTTIEIGTLTIEMNAAGNMTSIKGATPEMSVPLWPILEAWLTGLSATVAANSTRFATCMPGTSSPNPPPPPMPPNIASVSTKVS